MDENTRQRTFGRRGKRARLATGMMAAIVAAAGSAWAVAPALVAVGDPGNAADATGFGAVANAYRIGTYEVTRTEYAAFLNAVAAADPHGLYNPAMGITRSGVAGSYQYAAVNGARPVAFVSWYDALRYANWLHNGQPIGEQTAATTEDGAYAFSGNAVAGPRKPEARVFLPNDNEWYKAAYYQGGGDAWYWQYPTRSDTPPLAAAPPGDDNAANYDRVAGGATAVGAYGASRGYYGTYDQAGNLWEWTESAAAGGRVIRGGSFDDYRLLLGSWYRDSQAPGLENKFVGFRVAALADGAIPPPAFDMTWAAWRAATRELTVQGIGPAGKTVLVRAPDGTRIGTCTVRADGKWKLRVTLSFAQVPKRVRASCQGAADGMIVVLRWND